MAQLELKTSVLNGHEFRLFKESGEEISLPGESGWEFVYPQMSGFESPGYFPDPDKKLLLDLESGKYWLIESNHNVTTTYKLHADSSTIQRTEVGGVANGFPEQIEEVGRVAVAAPRPVFDLFMQLGGIKP